MTVIFRWARTVPHPPISFGTRGISADLSKSVITDLECELEWLTSGASTRPVCPPPWLPPSRPESRVGSSAVRGRETPSLWGHAERSCGSAGAGHRGGARRLDKGDRWQDRDGSIGGVSSITSRTAGMAGSIASARAPPTSPLPSGCWRPGWPNGRATPDRGRSRLTPSPCVVSHIGGRRHRVNVRGALVWAHQRAQSLPPTIAHGETLYPTPMGNPSAR